MVCEVRTNKDNPNFTRITVAGNRVSYPGDIATPTGYLELLNLIINSILSRPGAIFECFDINNFYLDISMECSEYVRIKLSVIPQ